MSLTHSLTFCCSGCQKKYTAKPHLAGKKFKCPACGEITRIPALETQEAPTESVEAATLPPRHGIGNPSQEMPTLPPSLPAPAATDETATLPPSRHTSDPNDTTDDTDEAATIPPLPSSGNTTVSSTDMPRRHRDGNGNLPTFPGYEDLREIGRGGMGVVYRARQVRLKRPVALKVILAGSHAGSKELERFETEAEAVARLQHPGIVQVYEFGERERCPFLALEYVEGGSLAGKLKETGPLKPKEAARIVAQIARAMQAAHDEDILHRDLKPANVLMTADGEPKVTDFGLAKLLDSSEGHTASGAIMGTPSYMAPEQAEGKKDITQAVDIYALGAILYELVSGKPPFHGPTAMDTLMQVVSEQPVSPRHLVPGLPRDLETICLKCLQKQPRQRFASAADLADDLERFVEGEPIRARLLNPIEKAGLWVKAQPGVAFRLGAAIILLLILSYFFQGGWPWFATAATTLAFFLGTGLRAFWIGGATSFIVVACSLSGLLLGNLNLETVLFPNGSPHVLEGETLRQQQKLQQERIRKGLPFQEVNFMSNQTSWLLEKQAYAIWRLTPWVYVAAFVVCMALLLGGLIGFASSQETWMLRWLLPPLVIGLLAGLMFVSSSSTSSIIGGVLGGFSIAAVSRLVAHWLNRDTVAAVQGGIFGGLAGIVIIFGALMLAPRFPFLMSVLLMHPLLQLLVILGTFLLVMFLGTIRGAFAANTIRSRVKAQ